MPKQPPPKTGAIERHYSRMLRKVARHVGDIVGAFPPGDPSVTHLVTMALEKYADTITGWAAVTGMQMLTAVNKQDEVAWRERAREMSAALRNELRNAPTGAIMKDLLAEQVTLIKSLPKQAGQRVHDLTLKGLESSSRGEEIKADILRTGDVTASRATLIARTEVARAASLLTEARARYVGSEGYIWRTSGDSDVRASHKAMNTKYFRWDTPPTLSDGTTTHAGQIYNCRCYPEPVIPE